MEMTKKKSLFDVYTVLPREINFVQRAVEEKYAQLTHSEGF